MANTIKYWRKRFQSITKVVFYMPIIVSEVALVVVWKWIFNPSYGLSATVTRLLGMDFINWFGDLTVTVPLLAVLILHFTVAQPIILFSAAIGNIPQSYYEAAELDGASRTRQFFRITLPLIRPTMAFVLITSTIANLQVFTVPYLLTAGGPDYGTTTILFLICRNAFQYGQFGYAALGVVLFLIIAAISALQFVAMRSDVEYYTFARRRFFGKSVLFAILMATMMLPRQILMVPNFMVLKNFGLIDNLAGVVLTSISAPFGVFLCRQFMSTLPGELFEAAQIDGCGTMGVFLRLVVPLSKPVLGALAIFSFINGWNDFMWQNIVLSSKVNRTMPIAIAFLTQDQIAYVGYQLAGATLSAVPMLIIFFVFQKYFIRGITMGAVKG